MINGAVPVSLMSLLITNHYLGGLREVAQ